MVLPVLALAVAGYEDYSPLMLGFVLGAYGLTQALLQIPLGLLSDQIGRQSVIIGGLMMFVAGSVLAALSESMLGLMLGRALQGAGAIASTLMALITDLTLEHNRSKAMAAIGGSIGFSFIFAMMLGPIITAMFGLSGIFWLTAILGLFGIGIMLFFIPKVSMIQRNREAITISSDIKKLLRDPILARLNLGIFALHLSLMAAFVAVPSILDAELMIDTLKLPWVYLGLLGGGFFLMLPAMIAAEKYHAQKFVFLLSIAIMIIATFTLGWHRNSVITPIMLLIFFASFNLLEASLPSWLSKSCPVGYRGTAMGIYSTSQFLGAFVGSLLGGLTIQYWNIDTLFYSVCLNLLIWLIISLGLKSPRPLQTLVLAVGDSKHQDFLKIITNIAGVEDILLINGEHLAYVQIDRVTVDMQSLQPYLNR